MPAQSSGMETFGGGSPGITVSNAMSNTPFNMGSAAAGVGTGSLGQFGGYIPTPLPQFNNYTDYMAAMPGAQQMNSYAEQMIKAPFYQMNPDLGWGLLADQLASPFPSQAIHAGQQAEAAALGPAGKNNRFQDTGQGYIYRDWYPEAQRMYGFGQQLGQQGTSLFGLEDPIKQQAFDPQSALYQRTLQQVQEQARAADAARGMVMTPYSAGVEDQATSNFNIDWQNQQLQRELQGAQGIGGLAQTGGELLGAAGAMGQSAADLQKTATQQTMAIPQELSDYYNQTLQDQLQMAEAAGQFGQMAAAPYQQAFQNWQDIQNQFLTANQQSFNQNQTAGFEDPFSMLQLQSQIEMQREQMNQQEQMQKSQQNAQMGMQGAQMGMGLLSSMGGKCWIAEAIYGVTDPRTYLVRRYLNGPFEQHWYGKIVMWLYGLVGQQVAKIVRRSRLVRKALTPLFNLALRNAVRWHQQIWSP